MHTIVYLTIYKTILNDHVAFIHSSVPLIAILSIILETSEFVCKYFSTQHSSDRITFPSPWYRNFYYIFGFCSQLRFVLQDSIDQIPPCNPFYINSENIVYPSHTPSLRTRKRSRKQNQTICATQRSREHEAGRFHG